MKNKRRLIVALIVIIVGCFLWWNYSKKEKELVVKSDLTESNYKGKIKSIKRIIRDGAYTDEFGQLYYIGVGTTSRKYVHYRGERFPDWIWSSSINYNIDGNITSKYKYSKFPSLDENGEYVLKEQLAEETQYDDKGNKVSIDEYVVDYHNLKASESVLTDRKVFEYNDNGDIIKQISSNSVDGWYPEAIEDTTIIYFKYDANGNKVKEEKEEERGWSREKGIKTKSEKHFEYDENGNKVMEVEYNSSGDTSSIIISQYDSRSNLVIYKRLEFSHISHTKRRWVRYGYRSIQDFDYYDNRMIRSQHYNIDSIAINNGKEEWLLDYIYNYKYNKKNLFVIHVQK